MNIGYVRVSTADQNEARQLEKMKQLDIDERHLFIEKASGKDFDRPKYQAMKMVLREGDILYIDALDRFGRDYDEIIKEWKQITREIGADIVVLEQESLFDTRKFKAMGEYGKLLEDQTLNTLAFVAEQERLKIKRRQAEGIAIAKTEGKYKGRKPKAIDMELFENLYARTKRKECTHNYAMMELGLSRAAYYRARKEYETKTGRWANGKAQ